MSKVGKWFDKVLKWHSPDKKPRSFDGMSVHSVCKYCNKEIMQDSQGGWF
jgi:hypothetical protein